MSRQEFQYLDPERFVAGTVGPPGQRTFYLQARDGSRVTSVSLEKQQVAVLAERLDALLDAVLRRSGGTAPVPAVVAESETDLDPLDTPIEEEFRTGALSLQWDDETEHVVIEAFSSDRNVTVEDLDPAALATEDAAEDEDALAEDRDLLRVSITGHAARAFAERAVRVVNAGRPPCPFCTLPLEPEGHICPRQNGYRRRD